MDEELRKRFDALEEKIAEIERVTTRMYKIFVWTGIITIALFVLPLIGLVFAVPSFLSYYTSVSGISNSIQ